MTTKQYTVGAVKATIEDIVEHMPGSSNPVDDRGFCVYSTTDDDRRCLVGQVLHELDLEVPPPECGDAVGQLDGTVQAFTHAALDYLCLMQRRADKYEPTNDRATRFGREAPRPQWGDLNLSTETVMS